jgi:hypothetical protein
MILKPIFAFILFISCLSINAQSTIERLEATKEVFRNNSIYVIYSGKAVLDSALKECFNKFWTIQPIKRFISRDEFKELIKDKSNSFFYPMEYHYDINRMGGNTDRFTSGIFAFNGGRKNLNKYNLIYESVTIECFDTYRGESNMENCVYRLPLMVTKMQCEINSKHDADAIPKFDIKKILLINENLVEGKKGASIQRDALAAWPGKYELMSPEKIAKFIRERNNQYLLLTPLISDASAGIILYDLATMKEIAFYGRNGILKGWVRDKDIHGLIDKINDSNIKRK